MSKDTPETANIFERMEAAINALGVGRPVVILAINDDGALCTAANMGVSDRIEFLRWALRVSEATPATLRRKVTVGSA